MLLTCKMCEPTKTDRLKAFLYYSSPNPTYYCDECDSEIEKYTGRLYYYLGDNIDICSKCWSMSDFDLIGEWKKRIPDDYRSRTRICVMESDESIKQNPTIRGYRSLAGIIMKDFIYPENDRFTIR